MTYREIHYQIGIIHANLLDLQHYLHNIGVGQFTDRELEKTEFALSFLRKHLNKPIMMPRVRNPKPRSQP